MNEQTAFDLEFVGRVPVALLGLTAGAHAAKQEIHMGAFKNP